LWKTLVAPYGPSSEVVIATFGEMVARYAEPQRHYHTLDHVLEVLGEIDALVDLASDAAPVRFAGFLHDVVYDPTRHDNEAVSAQFAREMLARLSVPEAAIDETARLIELTAGHAVGATDRNGAVLADADLAILAAAPARYERYARGVRMEYS